MDILKKSLLGELEESLVKTIVSEDLIENFGAISEALLDSEIVDGVIQNIPFFDILYKTGKIALSVRDKIFEKKLLYFLLELKDIPADKRNNFIQELEEKSGQRAGETLLMLIERLDNVRKTKIIANLLKAKINGDINIEKFLRLSAIVDRGFLNDLEKLSLFKSPEGAYEEDISESLHSLGLLYIFVSEFVDTIDQNNPTFNNSGNNFKITNTGLDLLKYGFMID